MSFINLRNKRYFPHVRDTPHHADTTNDLFFPSPNTVKTGKATPRAVPEPPQRRLRQWCSIAGVNFGSSVFGIHNVFKGEADYGLEEAGEPMEQIWLRTNGLLNDPEGGMSAVKAINKVSCVGSAAVMYTVNLVEDEDQHLCYRRTTILHIPNAASVRVFNCEIGRLFEINDAFHAKVEAGQLGNCQRCQQPAASRCERCKSSYCGMGCQKRDWLRHKDECQVISQIRDWSTFDWEVYDKPYEFKKSLRSATPVSSS